MTSFLVVVALRAGQPKACHRDGDNCHQNTCTILFHIEYSLVIAFDICRQRYKLFQYVVHIVLKNNHFRLIESNRESPRIYYAKLV